MALKIGDEVCFLQYRKFYAGTIVSIGTNNFLLGIEVDGEVLYCKPKYAAPIDAKFCIVTEETAHMTKPKIRIDYTTYPVRNKTWEHWTNEASWIKEFFDPYELRQKATVYGLEI